jgi:CxxC-x17-CxxC domain-containing protein
MSFQNKNLKCSDCGKTFTLSVDEQRYFLSKGSTHEPKRCPDCYQARNLSLSENSGYNYWPVRQMFHVVCADCGKETEMPFKPRQGKPVYCRDCYRKSKLNI